LLRCQCYFMLSRCGIRELTNCSVAATKFSGYRVMVAGNRDFVGSWSGNGKCYYPVGISVDWPTGEGIIAVQGGSDGMSDILPFDLARCALGEVDSCSRKLTDLCG